jgi:hypothetical protein
VSTPWKVFATSAGVEVTVDGVTTVYTPEAADELARLARRIDPERADRLAQAADLARDLVRYTLADGTPPEPHGGDLAAWFRQKVTRAVAQNAG